MSQSDVYDVMRHVTTSLQTLNTTIAPDKVPLKEPPDSARDFIKQLYVAAPISNFATLTFEHLPFFDLTVASGIQMGGKYVLGFNSYFPPAAV